MFSSEQKVKLRERERERKRKKKGQIVLIYLVSQCEDT